VDLLYTLMLQVSRVEMEVFPRQALAGYEEACYKLDRNEDTGFQCFVNKWAWRNGEQVSVERFDYIASTQEVIDLMESVEAQPQGMWRSIIISTEW
jgi:hypothetical protein